MGVLVFGRQLEVEPNIGFLRGDCNNDAMIDITDAIRALEFLFLGTVELDCTAACDADGSTLFDFTDAIYTLEFFLLGGSPPVFPWPECGAAEIESGLECDRSCP